MTPTPPPARRALAAAALLGTAALAAACGTATYSAGQGGATPANPTPPTATSPVASGPPSSPRSPSPEVVAGGPACSTSALSAGVDVAKISAAAGSIYYPIDFTNISSATCRLHGYPQVAFVDGKPGHLIGSPASRDLAGSPPVVMLAPHAVAHATLQIADAGNYQPGVCRPVTARWLRVYPPGQTAPLYARLRTEVCSAMLPASVGGQLGVSAIQHGAVGNGP